MISLTTQLFVADSIVCVLETFTIGDPLQFRVSFIRILRRYSRVLGPAAAQPQRLPLKRALYLQTVRWPLSDKDKIQRVDFLRRDSVQAVEQ